MQADAITVGMRVRYPRTGTTGSVTRIELVSGKVFAEIDSTRLLYRADQLIPAPVTRSAAPAAEVAVDAKEVIARERNFAAGGELAEALKNIDQSCEGGG